MLPNFAQSRQTTSKWRDRLTDTGLSGDATKDPYGQGHHGTSSGGGWARAPDLSSFLIPIPFLFRMEWATGEQGRYPQGQPGPWELRVGLLLSGERAW